MISEADDTPKRTRQITTVQIEKTAPDSVQVAKSSLPAIAPAVQQPKTFSDRAKSYVEQKKIGIQKSAYGEALDEITALMKKYADEFPDHIGVLISTIRHFEKKHLQK